MPRGRKMAGQLVIVLSKISRIRFRRNGKCDFPVIRGMVSGKKDLFLSQTRTVLKITRTIATDLYIATVHCIYIATKALMSVDYLYILDLFDTSLIGA